MAGKRNAVDRVIDALKVERAQIDATIARLETAQAGAAKPRKASKKLADVAKVGA